MKLRNFSPVRLYPRVAEATDYATGTAGAFYPQPTSVVDAVELVFQVRKWFDTTSQSMGNWVSAQELSERLAKTGIKPVPVSREEIPLARLNRVLKDTKMLTMIGFDILHIPICRISFRVE